MDVSSPKVGNNKHIIETDLFIIGSGPAGYTAAIYAARAYIDFYIAAGLQSGGQLMLTEDVENYPGFEKGITGPSLMDQMRKQSENAGAKIIDDDVVSFRREGDRFISHTSSGTGYVSKAVIAATGAQALWLNLESEKKFMGHGVSACAVCDGLLYRDQVVAVVGGGNVAVEEALHLAKYVKKVYLIHRRDTLRAELIAQEKLKKEEKVEFVWNSVVEEIVGNDKPVKYVTGIKVKSTKDNSIREIPIDGIFVAIGHAPSTALFKDYIAHNQKGYLLTEGKTSMTSIPGFFAAGDVCDDVYRQAVVAAAGGCMAALDAERYLSS